MSLTRHDRASELSFHIKALMNILEEIGEIPSPKKKEKFKITLLKEWTNLKNLLDEIDLEDAINTPD